MLCLVIAKAVLGRTTYASSKVRKVTNTMTSGVMTAQLSVTFRLQTAGNIKEAVSSYTLKKNALVPSVHFLESIHSQGGRQGSSPFLDPDCA